MAIDTPATIVIIGSGPIGIEAGLYARFLGYEVTILEQGEVAQSVQNWGHVKLFTPFSMNSTPLGISALHAQIEDFQLPEPDALLTGQEFLDQYLLPLANSDLIVDSILTQHKVLAVGRTQQLKGEFLGDEQREETQFSILVKDKENHERVLNADIVIDCSGTFNNPNHLGVCGIPAIGEIDCQDQIEYHLPDVLGNDREQYATKQTLVIGSGYSAATNVCALAQLAAESLETHITWITRDKLNVQPDQPPILSIENDPLSEREQLCQQANQLATSADAHVTHWANSSIEKIHFDQGSKHFQVSIAGEHEGTHTFDRIIANVGYRPDHCFTRELQVHHCYASEGPMKLASQLLGNITGNCLDQTTHGVESLITSEPNFYILGAKSYGRSSQFLLSVGIHQIKELFSLIGDRAELDLYQNTVLPK